MIGFFVKKTFFDAWDRLLSLVLLNLGFIACVLVALLGMIGGTLFGRLLALCAAALGFVWFSACHFALLPVSDFGSLRLAELLHALRRGLAPGLQFGAMLAGLGLVASTAIPFYAARGGLPGLSAAGLVFWGCLFCLMALQYFLPLRARMEGGFVKTLRKCFLLCFDNPGFSVFLFFHNLFGFFISLFSALLIPGFAGLALAGDVALRLRLYKYDWLEKNPRADRKKIPWDELVAEDRELLGTRTLKGMIFPWKE